MKLDLEKAITQEVARMLTVGYEYQTEYGPQTKEAALTPHIRNWLSSNGEQIMEQAVKTIGKKELIETITVRLVEKLTDTNYSAYKWESLYKEVAPLIADKVAQKMYEDHKKELCK